jgi:exonuclease III
MNKLNYKDLELISLNVAGWNWRISNENWENRLRRICSYIKVKKSKSNSLVIALQEVQLSGGKYLSVLEEEFPDYHIILPNGFKKQAKSVMSILLINKKLCKSYNIGTLEDLEDSLRYNFVTINTHIEGLCFRILNTNVPHNCFNDDNTAEWYKQERIELSELFIKRITELANTYSNEPDMKLIMLGDFNAIPDSEFIESLAYTYINRPMIDAVKPQFKNSYTWKDYKTNAKSRLDYILYSAGMLCNTCVSAKFTIIDDTTILQELSDHAVVIGGIKLDIA